MSGINVEAGSFYDRIRAMQGPGVPVYFVEFSADAAQAGQSFGALARGENEKALLSGEMIIEECLGIDLEAYRLQIFDTIRALRSAHLGARKVAVHFLRGRSTKRILEKIVLPQLKKHHVDAEFPIVEGGHQHYLIEDSDPTFRGYTKFFGGYRPEATDIYQSTEFDLVICIGIFCSLVPCFNMVGKMFILKDWYSVNLNTAEIALVGQVLDSIEQSVVQNLHLQTISLGGTIEGFYDFRKYI
jgi:hypothetical protein